MPKPPRGETLTDKQRRFVEQYVKDFNATQAAIRAGYSKRTAESIGKENLLKPLIKARLDTLRQALTEEARLTAAAVLEEIAAVGFVRLGNYVDGKGALDIVRLAKEQPAAIAEITHIELETKSGKKITITKTRRRVKVHDKLEALGQLGRYFKLFQTDVRQKDVPADATPAAPRVIHDYTTAELLEQIARDEAAKKPHGRRRKRA